MRNWTLIDKESTRKQRLLWEDERKAWSPAAGRVEQLPLPDLVGRLQLAELPALMLLRPASGRP